MSEKLVTGSILFTAVSLFTYHFMGHNLKPKKSNRKHIKFENYKTPISPIVEGINEEEVEDDKIKTPSNTPISSHELYKIDDISDLQLDHQEKENTPLLIIQDNISDIIDNMENFDKKVDSNTNSMSSFVELCNTYSLTDTEELEFYKVDDTILKRISNVSKEFPSAHIYGTADIEEPIGQPISLTLDDNPTYSESMSDINISYYSDGEKYKTKRRKKVNGILKFLKRNKSN